jgi:hypothetical protein
MFMSPARAPLVLALAWLLFAVPLAYATGEPAARSAASAPAVLGDEALELGQGELPPGRSQAFLLRARLSAVARSAHVYIDRHSSARTVLIGVYADARGRPGALLSSGSISAPRMAAWNTAALAPSQLIATKSYWLTVLGRGGTLRIRERRHAFCRSYVRSVAHTSALPRRWRAGGVSLRAHCPLSAYLSSVVGVSPKTTPPGLLPLGKPLVSVLAKLPAPGASGSSTPTGAPGHAEVPVLTGAPTINGTLIVGQVLAGTRGGWSGEPSGYAYQWQRCNSAGASCANVAAATGPSYTLASADAAHTMRLLVAASNAAGSASASSAQTGLVAAAGSGTSFPPCTQTISQGANVAAAVVAAAGGSVICLTSGSYGHLALSASHASDVALQAAPSAHVDSTAIDISGSHIAIRGLWIAGEVVLNEGASHITIDHDDISGGGEGVVFETSDCTAPNAPKWAGCEPHAAITDVILSGNHFHDIGESGSEDAIHLDNWRNVTISGNEFDHIIESGNHTDCMQSVYGGSGLSFDHNYEHDNDCQGFFVKDGDASDVAFTDNLFLRDNEPDEHGARFGNLAQFWNIEDLTVERNTIWDGKGIVLVAEDAQLPPSASVTHNMLSNFSLSKPVGTPYALSESFNVFGEAPSSLASRSSTDAVNANPQFNDSATDDYRLAHNPNSIGIDWSASESQYGPIA